MKVAITSAAALLAGTVPVLAGGIERGNQMLGVLFEPGNYAELSYGHVKPTVEGTDLPQTVGGIPVYPGGVATGNVSNSYNLVGLAYKHQFNESWSAAVILDQPFGADIYYPNPAAGEAGTPLLGGTLADVSSTHLTGVVRYKMPENGFGVHAGLRVSRANGTVALDGLAYGGPPPAGISGYRVDLDNDTAAGWLAGISWEKPEIAARVSLTYNSPITHEFDTTETIAGVPVSPMTTTEVDTPKSWNLEFQTGVASDTLVFGSIRWVDWSSFRVAPSGFFGPRFGSLVELEDSTTYTLGVARKFNDTWSGAASFSFEKAGDDLVSPLAPTNGRKGITLAAIYTRGNMKVTTGVNYTKLGDALAETGTPDTPRASMSGNSAWGIGVKVGYSF